MRSFALFIFLSFLTVASLLSAQEVSPATSETVSPTTGLSITESTLTAAPAGKPPKQAPTPLTLSEVRKKMGLLAYPLLALSFFAVAMIFFVLFTVRQNLIVSDALINVAHALIRKQDYLGLLAVCNRRPEALAHITAKALDFATKNPTASFDEVREVAESEGSRQSSMLLQRVSYLADIGSMAPLIGLLGTVVGLITSFNEIAGSSGQSQSVGVAKGVYEALYCTAGGLIIGIPCLMAYSVFRGKVQRLISELEAAATHILALLSSQYKRTSRQQAVTRATASTESAEHNSLL